MLKCVSLVAMVYNFLHSFHKHINEGIIILYEFTSTIFMRSILNKR